MSEEAQLKLMEIFSKFNSIDIFILTMAILGFLSGIVLGIARYVIIYHKGWPPENKQDVTNSKSKSETIP